MPPPIAIATRTPNPMARAVASEARKQNGAAMAAAPFALCANLFVEGGVQAPAPLDQLFDADIFQEFAHRMHAGVDRHDRLRGDAPTLQIVEEVHVLRVDRRLRLSGGGRIIE